MTTGRTQHEDPARRPYLDPQPGEHLPEKKVSSKAYARLAVAADAIAATKKAIAHQGNQVPALKETKMNSLARLRVMRDDDCWEFTNEQALQLAQENPEAFIAAKADIAHGGNCGENAWVAFHYLRAKAKGEKIQVSQADGLDHAFVLIGDVQKEPDNALAVSDPWPNNPTACLWEDHFAYTADKTKVIAHHAAVADGKSFKDAIRIGLKLSAKGEAMVKQVASEAETTKMTDDWQKNHFWDQDDAAATKYKYVQEKAAQGASGHAAEQRRAEQSAP